MGLVSIELRQGKDAAIPQIPELNTWSAALFTDHGEQSPVSTDGRVLLAAIEQGAGGPFAAP